MRIAVLNDIHGNLPALDATLAEARQAGVDQIVVGGDVLPGPMPRETMARLLALDIPAQFIYGNGDRAILAQLTASDPGEVTYLGDHCWRGRTRADARVDSVDGAAGGGVSRRPRELAADDNAGDSTVWARCSSATRRRATRSISSRVSRLKNGFCRCSRASMHRWWCAVTRTCSSIAKLDAHAS